MKADWDPDLRAADEDRERVVSVLREHMLAGRLSTEEFSSRIGRAFEAATLGDLDDVLKDLPAIAAPMSLPRTRRQRAHMRQHQRQMASWEQARSISQSHLDLARSRGTEGHGEFPCGAGEMIVARVPGTVLRLWATTPGHTERRTTSYYSRNLFGGGRRTGTTHTYKVPGRDVQVTADVGTMYITNRRIGFRGPKRTLDLPMTTGVSANSRSRRIVVSLPIGRPVTYRYPKDPTGRVAFATRLALAHSRGTVSSLVAELESDLAELDRSKPVLSLEAVEPQPKNPLKRPAQSTSRADRTSWANLSGDRSSRATGGAVAAMSAGLRGSLTRRQGLTLLAIGIVIAIWIGLAASHGHSSYSDGYQWGEANTVGVLSKTAPSCSWSEMVSSGEVNDSNFIFNKPEGDNEPKDNYVQWQAGCEAAARSVIASFDS